MLTTAILWISRAEAITHADEEILKRINKKTSKYLLVLVDTLDDFLKILCSFSIYICINWITILISRYSELNNYFRWIYSNTANSQE